MLVLAKTPARTHRRIRGGRGTGKLGLSKIHRPLLKSFPFTYSHFLERARGSHFRRLEFSRIIDLFQNVSREAGSAPVSYDVPPLAPTLASGLLKRHPMVAVEISRFECLLSGAKQTFRHDRLDVRL